MGIWTEGEETGGKQGMKLPSQGAHTQGEPCVKVESVGRKVALNKNKRAIALNQYQTIIFQNMSVLLERSKSHPEQNRMFTRVNCSIPKLWYVCVIMAMLTDA